MDKALNNKRKNIFQAQFNNASKQIKRLLKIIFSYMHIIRFKLQRH